MLAAIHGSMAEGTHTACRRKNECDEGRKRERTPSECGAEGIYHHLKREHPQPCLLNLSQQRSTFAEPELMLFGDFQKY